MERIKLQEIITEHSLFTPMLYDLIKSLLDADNINYHTIEQRTKTIESIEEKILRKNKKDIIKEINDISGIRIIVYYQEDVDKAIDLIKNNFTIDEENSINKASLYSSNEFGYLSVHYIVHLDNKRKNLPEWKLFSKLKAEIQIRTVLQHSWASISHELAYKKNYEIPKKLERKLYRLAGLFELADEQFSIIKREHGLLKELIENEKDISEMDNIEINLLTLKYGFEKASSVSNAIKEIAIDAGFIYYDGDDNEYYSEIVLISDIHGFRYLNEIEKSLKMNIENLKTYFKEIICNASFSKEPNWLGSKGFFLVLAMLFLLDKKMLYKYFKKCDWDKNIINNIKKVKSKIKNNN
jgi:ppGpp synthetase/RelA/SpoT-type nucleotidyltranferase